MSDDSHSHLHLLVLDLSTILHTAAALTLVRPTKSLALACLRVVFVNWSDIELTIDSTVLSAGACGVQVDVLRHTSLTDTRGRVVGVYWGDVELSIYGLVGVSTCGLALLSLALLTLLLLVGAHNDVSSS